MLTMQGSSAMCVELPTLEKARSGSRSHRTPLPQNDESISLQEPVNVEQQQPECVNRLKGSSAVVAINPKLKRFCRIIIVCVVTVVVWGTLALPILFYYLDLEQVSMEADRCTSENYTGCICREVLQVQQSCLPDRTTTSDIIIAADPTVNQRSKEEKANTLIEAILSQKASSNCMEELIPFLCFYIFPLCDSSGQLYQPSSVDCSTIANGTCANETEIVTNIFREDVLECQVLPETSTTLKCNVTDDLSTVMDHLVNTTSSNTSAMEMACSDGFYLNEGTGLCVPECGVWMEFHSGKSAAFDIIAIASAIVYLVGGTTVVVFSCINHKRMDFAGYRLYTMVYQGYTHQSEGTSTSTDEKVTRFSIPTVFIVYGIIVIGVSELLLIIGYSDRTSLYCSSRNLLTSIMNETQFCTVQGLIFTYAILVQTLFWFFHVIILFWGVKFPFHAKHFGIRGYSKYIHIAVFVLAISLPCGHIAAVVATGGVTMAQFPPIICLARDTDAILYSFIIPISIINATGILFLLLIMWSLIIALWTQQKKAKISGIKKTSSVGTATVKVQIILLYILIITLYNLPVITVSNLTKADFMERLITYFNCESQGIQAGRTCERMFNRSTGESLINVNLIFFSLFPVVSLIFFSNFHEMKKKLSRCLNGNSKHNVT